LEQLVADLVEGEAGVGQLLDCGLVDGEEQVHVEPLVHAGVLDLAHYLLVKLVGQGLVHAAGVPAVLLDQVRAVQSEVLHADLLHDGVGGCQHQGPHHVF
jgi:hypothetical protein